MRDGRVGLAPELRQARKLAFARVAKEPVPLHAVVIVAQPVGHPDRQGRDFGDVVGTDAARLLGKLREVAIRVDGGARRTEHAYVRAEVFRMREPSVEAREHARAERVLDGHERAPSGGDREPSRLVVDDR